MSKVMIIGAGAQGNVISGVLSQAEDVEMITLGDIDLDRANEVFEYIGSEKINTLRIDASDSKELETVLKQEQYDLVVNATIPIFTRPILKATLNAGLDYIDMASNEMLKSKQGPSVQKEFIVEQFEFAEDFENKGCRALILAGGDSGLVNVMAREVVDDLDEIDYIGIKDYGVVECDEPVAMWSMMTYLEDSATPAVYWENGEYKYAPVFSGEEEYYFPPPLDRWGKVYYHSHEEPVTIPKFIGKPVKYCDFKLGEPGADIWRFIIQDLGLMDREPIQMNGQSISPREFLYKKLPPTLTPKKCIELTKNGRLMSQLQLTVDVKGRKRKEYFHYKLWTESPNSVQACSKIPGTNDVSWITSIPASIFSLMLLRGQIQKTGVFPCEVLNRGEREIFFDQLKEWNIKIHQQISGML
ncbi:MAG: saccharopine dehydrogenase NADP-binding domain-containing protein [Desulfohalobiaceae bacterium]|nr:saccharopine dehydrogenase NADP-binding domain-containing protein [Desulfohalobiaceae bacterium]